MKINVMMKLPNRGRKINQLAQKYATRFNNLTCKRQGAYERKKFRFETLFPVNPCNNRDVNLSSGNRMQEFKQLISMPKKTKR